MSTPTQASSGIPQIPTDHGGATPVDHGDRQYQSMSLRGPAMVVVAIATFIAVSGVVASLLTSAGNHPTLSLRSIAIPGGRVVRLMPAASALRPIIGSQPPADILAALAVPSGSKTRSWRNFDQHQVQYDRTVSFTTRLSSAQVISLYQTLLPRMGWAVLYQGPSTVNGVGGTEILARRGSKDGYYWEVGAVVSPATAGGVTPYNIVIYELNSGE
ncbi:MAG: hypothetical protein ACYCV7_07025 [Acidimicrobiales bacterium]